MFWSQKAPFVKSLNGQYEVLNWHTKEMANIWWQMHYYAPPSPPAIPDLTNSSWCSFDLRDEMQSPTHGRTSDFYSTLHSRQSRTIGILLERPIHWSSLTWDRNSALPLRNYMASGESFYFSTSHFHSENMSVKI